MRSERKARISGLAGTEHARNRTLPDLTFPVTEWNLGSRLDHSQFDTSNLEYNTTFKEIWKAWLLDNRAGI